MLIIVIHPQKIRTTETKFEIMSVFRRGRISFLFVLMSLIMFTILIIAEITLFPAQKSLQSQGLSDGYVVRTHCTEVKSNSINVSESPVFPIKDWQPVRGTRFKFYVYSAYLDIRNKNRQIVRIIATTKTKKQDRVACLFYYGDSSELIPAKIMVINENWSLQFSAVFLVCNLRNVSHIPLNVSVVPRNYAVKSQEPLSNNLPILNRIVPDDKKIELEDKIAFCIKPIHYEYDKVVELVEFLELNRLLGVEHFITYNSSMSSRTKCILDEYIKKGIVDVHPWQLPLKSKIEIRTENIFAALNDCLYRNMFSYEHIIFADLDEFIVPKFNSTIHELMRWLSKRYDTTRISAYLFQNAFFYRQWEDDPQMSSANEVEKKLITMRKTRRRSKLNPFKQRSKLIVKPKNIVEVGNHFVWQFLSKQNTMNVPSNVASLHHYRVCEFGGDDCVRSTSIVDRTLHRFRRSLSCAFAKKWSYLSTKCTLPDVNVDDVNGC